MSKHAWGKSRSIYCDGKIQVDLIRGWDGGASSLHCHHFKHNLFIVLAGGISLTDEGGDETHLLKGDVGSNSALIRAGDWHRMTFTAHTTAIEVYMSTAEIPILDPVATMYADIERKDVGVEPTTVPLRHPHNIWPLMD